MGLVLNLESFDSQLDKAQEAPPATYEDGYAAGLAEAQAQFELDQSRLKESVVQALNDSVLGYQEAQSHFVIGMQTYLDAVFNCILPAVLAPALHAQLIQILKEGVTKDAQEPVKLNVSSDQFATVTRLVGDLGFTHIAVVKDASLSEHAAFITSQTRELSLDVDAALSAIKQQSAVLLEPMDKVS